VVRSISIERAVAAAQQMAVAKQILELGLVQEIKAFIACSSPDRGTTR
jgi:hypothetical protein